jgi:hypothetical protein
VETTEQQRKSLHKDLPRSGPNYSVIKGGIIRSNQLAFEEATG